MTSWPQQLQVNAWSGTDENRSPADESFQQRLLSSGLALADLRTLAPVPIDPRNWADPRVGWGVVLPEADGLSESDLAKAGDAPAPIQELVAARNGAVLRYRQDRSVGTIRRYYSDGTGPQDILVASQSFGTGPGQIPRYLLIYGSPGSIPWSFQFELQQSCFAGRLDLVEEPLERYVHALLNDWADSAAQHPNSVIWAVDHAPGDITHLMRDAITAPLHASLMNDPDPAFQAGARFIDGGQEDASTAALIDALVAGRPSLVATSSHGMTGPLNNVAAMQADLGQLVDSAKAQVRGADVLAQWQPDGAIWYAQACCSAGSRGETAFDGLVPQGSQVDRILKGVAACGEMMSPFPRALLSAAKPARAFVGHVEPTFDWSVRYPKTGQFITQPLLDAFYQRLFTGEPIGMALDSCRRLASELLHAAFATGRRDLAAGEAVPGDLLALRLIANDWKAMVLLGDPTCMVN